MAYHVYTTRGIVLSVRPSGEADRVYSILTEELGFVRARAGGVRLEKSKLRGMLEPLSLVRVSLVRGREWRITSAELIRVLPAVPELARPLALIERLVAGEERQPELFQAVETLLDEAPTPELETRIVAHILFHLGYLREEDLKLEGKALVSAINHSLKETHLV